MSRAPSKALSLTLAGPGRTLRTISSASAAEVCAWFSNRVPLVAPLDVLPVLDRWTNDLRGEAPPSIPGWRPEGPGRKPEEALPIIAFLSKHARRDEPFTFNALYLERQGGRMYPFYIDGYEGPVTISQRQYEAAKGPGARLLLSAIRRDARAMLEAPAGWSLLELDFKSCHAAIGVALSGDALLAADIAGDIHQLIGDTVARDEPEERRREIGKWLNNAMLFGVSPSGICDYAREKLGGLPRDGTGEEVWSWWWARYPKLAVFRDEVQALVRSAQVLGYGFVVMAPSGRVSRFSPAEVRGEVAKGRSAQEREDAWRTIFSACFRAVEGDLLNEVLRRFHADGEDGQPVLPMYDGLIVAAPVGYEERVTKAVRDAAEHAVAALGIPTLRAEVKQRRPAR